MTETTDKEVNGSNNPTELEAKIIRQIEYYFGDHNLVRDKFLQEQIKLDDGWIPLDVLTKFKRLKELSSDFSAITTALKKSSANLLEINDDGNKIRRNADNPLPDVTDEYKQEVNARSVYVKPFPDDTTIDQLLEYFKEHGNVENIQMRRFEKKFKGSVFVTFPSKECAEEFVKKEDVKYNDTDLIRELRADYHKRKSEEHANAKAEKKNKQNAKAEKKGDGDEEKKENGDKTDIKDVFEKDCVLKITGMSDKTSREHIKEVFSPFGEIAWVDSQVGDTEAKVRFRTEGTGKIALEKAKEKGNGKITVNEEEVEVVLLEGDEETEYWKVVKIAMVEKKAKRSGGFGGGHKRGRGRRGGHFRGETRRSKRLSGDHRDGGPPAKEAKTE